MTEWLSIEDLEQKTGIPDRTIRRYLRQFGELLPLQRQNRSYLVHSSGVEQVVQIRDLYAKGAKQEEITHLLSQSSSPALAMGVEQPIERILLSLNHQVATAFDQFAHRQELLQEEIGAMRDELASTRQQLQNESTARSEAQRAQERYFTQRDEQLIAAVRRTMAERRKPWWQRKRQA